MVVVVLDVVQSRVSLLRPPQVQTRLARPGRPRSIRGSVRDGATFRPPRALQPLQGMSRYFFVYSGSTLFAQELVLDEDWRRRLVVQATDVNRLGA